MCIAQGIYIGVSVYLKNPLYAAVYNWVLYWEGTRQKKYLEMSNPTGKQDLELMNGDGDNVEDKPDHDNIQYYTKEDYELLMTTVKVLSTFNATFALVWGQYCYSNRIGYFNN